MAEARTWADVNDLARIYGMSPNTVRNKVRSGHWPADRIGDGPRPMIRFSPEQQEEIESLVRTGRSRKNLDWLDDALDQIA